MRLYVSLAASIVIALAVLTACNSKEPNKSQGGSTEPSAGTSSNSSASSSRPSSPFSNPNSSTPNPAALPPVSGEARRITPDEVRNEVARNNAYIVDVRAESAYTQGHIKGAVLIPAGEILDHINQLPRNKMIITYCS